VRPAMFALECSMNGCSPEARVVARRNEIAPLRERKSSEWMKRERTRDADSYNPVHTIGDAR